MALTGKKKLFAEAKKAGMSNKDEALVAGYSAATASQAGSRLVKDKDVVAHLGDARKKAAPRAKTQTPEAAAVITAATGAGFDLNKILRFSDPKDFLLAAMNDQETEPKLRIDAAKTLMPFVHGKVGETGKKDQRDEAAKKVASRFSPAAPPKLVAAGGKKV